MRTNKSKRLIAGSILLVVLLALPIFEEVYYTAFYYAGVILLIPITIYRIVKDEKFDKRFYKRWHKARKQGFWISVIREGLRYFVFVTLVVSISQFLGNGRTPLGIVSKLSGGVLAWILLLLLAFSSIGGLVAWYENEKRYNRIHYSMKNNNK